MVIRFVHIVVIKHILRWTWLERQWEWLAGLRVVRLGDWGTHVITEGGGGGESPAQKHGGKNLLLTKNHSILGLYSGGEMCEVW